ncbi:activating signal cointegrator 1 complex subunit 3 [Striga asiatica]|uniref:Activating signal cointegrator 1 complex subunit 3 n=1 Tax=Striga asiatica TaxID=4170 RepID=A0A5A7RFE0_STRAF|nr:activating signal cointegrator 1 complex subunit 3 [Striga asiatica]
MLLCCCTCKYNDQAVMQIFGRAGRPQFDKSGEGIIITSHDILAYYLRLLTSELPIESQFINSLKDNQNAEVALRTVTNVKEACAWLGYTYLFRRMKMNPLAYGIGWDEVIADPSLSLKQRALVSDAARALDKAKMMRFDEKIGNFYCTELGRIGSHFYIQYSSVETYNELLRCHYFTYLSA